MASGWECESRGLNPNIPGLSVPLMIKFFVRFIEEISLLYSCWKKICASVLSHFSVFTGTFQGAAGRPKVFDE